MSSRRTGARKGPTAAERRAAQQATREALEAKLWTLTGEQARVVRDAFEAGPDGLYVPICGSLGAVCARLVEGGCGSYREVRRSGGTKSVHDQRPCEWSDWYFLPNAEGLSHIGVSPWPRNTVTCDTASEGAPDTTAPAAVGTRVASS